MKTTASRCNNEGEEDSMPPERLRSTFESKVFTSCQLSDATLRLVEDMDESQIEKAMDGLQVVKERRENSKMKEDRRRMSTEGLDMKEASGGRFRDELNDLGKRQSSVNGSKCLKSPKNVRNDINRDTILSLPSIPFADKTMRSSKKNISNDGAREIMMSRSVGAPIEDEDFNQYVSDSDTNAAASDEELTNYENEKIEEIFGATPQPTTVTQYCRANTSQSAPPLWKPLSERSTPHLTTVTQYRRASTSESAPLQWKPLSAPASKDKKDDGGKDEASKSVKGESEDAGGIGSLLKKFSRSLSAGMTSEPKKVIDGARYFRRGKRRADAGQFLEAVALFNFALVRQREDLGKNHVDCALTLNEIGLCWMMLGERYPAMIAFEEALYILQGRFGDGAQEVAAVVNNIWMVLHEEREDANTHKIAQLKAPVDPK